MKKFIRNLSYFFLLMLMFFLFENIMSGYYSDFKRPGTNLFFDTFFYPNENVGFYTVKEELGDKLLRTNIFTDNYGNRNKIIPDKLDLVLAGDSFSSLVMLPQEETITAHVNSLSNYKANTIRLKGVFGYQNNIDFLAGKYPKPKFVIYEIVERNLQAISVADSTLQYNFKLKDDLGNREEIIVLKKFINEGLDLPTLRFLQYMFRSSLVNYPAAIDDADFKFLEGKNTKYYSDEELLAVVQQLLKARQLTESNGMEFIFLPIPNKETIYSKELGFQKRPDNLDRLYKMLDSAEVNYVDVLDPLLRSSAKTYLNRDSHINETGSEIIASQIIRFLDHYHKKF